MRTEPRLAEQSDGSRAYDRAPCGLLTMTRTGTILEANGTFRKWLEIGSGEDLPIFLDLLRAGDRIFWDTHLGPLLDMQGQVNEVAVEIATPSGPVPALLNASTSTPGDPDGVIDIAIFRAVDRRSYERELLAERKLAEEAESRARDLAQTLQRSLIPPTVPSIPGLDVSAAYRPAGDGSEVGGDWYDVFQLGATSWMVTIGDVCGKGAGAAAMTAFIRYAIRGASMETSNLKKILRDVNEALLLERMDTTATVAMIRLDLAEEKPRVAVSSAGHPLPWKIDEAGRTHKLGSPGTLLGGFSEINQEVERFELEVGETLVLITDGVTEGRSGDEFFGEDRLTTYLSRTPSLEVSEIPERLAQDCVAFQDGHPRDDIAVVALRRSG